MQICFAQILLTANIDERAILIGKFIRLAFVSFPIILEFARPAS